MNYDQTISLKEAFDKFITNGNKETLTEAEEVTMDQLEKKDQATAKKIQRVLGMGQPDAIWDGIHGKIVYFQDQTYSANRHTGSTRLAPSQFKRFSKLPKETRWVEVGRDGVSVGF